VVRPPRNVASHLSLTQPETKLTAQLFMTHGTVGRTVAGKDCGDRMNDRFSNVYDDQARSKSYATLEFPGTYYLAYRDLPAIIGEHVHGRKAIDFGCGAGRSTRFLRDLGFDVVGVDISEPMLARARDLDPKGDYRLVPDGDLSSLEANAFDLILSAFTFDNVLSLLKTPSTV
jgi:ubiquinone/menaquinone biosynthesis C-methylase UbiE